jgi:hypothetical protein
MTPKEKAEELVDRFYNEVRYMQRSKECALIAVDELISSHNKWDDYAQTNSEEYYYWQEVKQEIEKL